MRQSTILICSTILFFACLPSELGNANPSAESISYGSGGCGKLEGGQQLPCEGANFEAFTWFACALGRTYLHPLIADTIAEAYGALRARYPERRWQYGDFSKQHGGPLSPHRTHQNGRAADFFFPVVDEQGAAAQVPINVFNHFGYGLNFRPDGRLGTMTVDWNALADHLLALEAAGKPRGVSIQKILLNHPLQTTFFREAPAVRHLKPRFNRKAVWSPHNEHYHVVFDIPAKHKRPLGCE